MLKVSLLKSGLETFLVLNILPLEDCVPICIKASRSRSRPAISTTLEAVHQGAPVEIKLSQLEREPHYAERIALRAPWRPELPSAQRSAGPLETHPKMFGGV